MSRFWKRWSRFSLRTMLLLVTLFGCWLGWQLKQVRQRDALLTQLLERGDVSYDSILAHWQRPGTVPWGWRLCGARPVASIWIKNKSLKRGLPVRGKEFLLGSSEARQLRALFPETYLFIRQDSGLYPSSMWMVDDPHKPNMELPDNRYSFKEVRQLERQYPDRDIWLVTTETPAPR